MTQFYNKQLKDLVSTYVDRLIKFPLHITNFSMYLLKYLDCSTVKKRLKDKYIELSHLSYANMESQLFAKSVITYNEKQQIRSKVTNTKKMTELLDIIISSLNAGSTIKYISFLKAMEESDDPVLQQTAKRLGKYIRRLIKFPYTLPTFLCTYLNASVCIHT